MKIAIVLPTRGLVFTEVEDAIEQMRLKHHVRVFRSSDLGIPDAQNTLTEEALACDPDYIFYIEEDTFPPEHALSGLITKQADVAFIDYGVNGWSCSARTEVGEILWCGLGCTLVKREVFNSLEKPYFRTDKSLRLNDWQWIDNPAKYGGQDIWFFTKVREAGFEIKQVAGECKHLELDSLGRRETNGGRHVIVQKPVIEKMQIIQKPVLTTEDVMTNNVNIGNDPLSF